MGARLRLLAAMLGVVLLGFAVGTAIDAVRLPGVDIAVTSTVRDLWADRSAPSVGRADAPVTVVIFTDYRCAICRRDHAGVAQVIASEPRARFVFKEWAILSAASKKAARTALAAAYQDRYLAVRDALMRGDAVEGVGVDPVRLQHDLERQGSAIEAELARTGRQAFALGLPGTPAYLVGQRLVVGGLSERQLRRLIARADAGA